MDPARLFRLHRPHLRSRDEVVLQPRTTLGERGAARTLALHNARVVAAATADAILAFAFAPACSACGALLDHPTRGTVCGLCWATVQIITRPYCDVCGEPLKSWRTSVIGVCVRCRRAPRALDCARSAGLYEGSLREVVHAFKYGRHRSLARPLASLMRGHASEALEHAHVSVPVPLHGARRRARGFNQAADLARHLGLPVVHALRRMRATASQANLPAGRRHANVRGAFVTTRAGGRLAGQIVVLVDDVITTGATLEACARTLKDAGVAEVRAVTAARAASARA